MDLLPVFEELTNNLDDAAVIEEGKKVLEKFICENEKTFEYSELDTTYHNKLLDKIFLLIHQHPLSLECIKITRLLSRDKNLVLNIKNVDFYMDIFAKLLKEKAELDSNILFSKVETVKCLCNWVYLSDKVRIYFKENNLIQIMIDEMKITDHAVTDYYFYEIRLMFLMSALEITERNQMLEDDAVATLVKVMKDAVLANSKSYDSSLHIPIICEVLKALFNITLELSNSTSASIVDDCLHLVCILQDMLVSFYPFNSDEKDDLLTHIAHMMVNMPKTALDGLVVNSNEDKEEQFCGHPVTYENFEMRSVIVFLDALKLRIQIDNYIEMKEKTMAILTAFCYVCRVNPVIRKYLKQEILPPLQPSDVRPEQFKDLRGKIVQLMTTVDVPLKNMAADFLFVLCKENSQRLIRYAGYGNSAGFLASRGLMIPGMSNADGDYSSDELTDVDDDVDPVTGAIPKPKDTSFESLSESEKEAEMEKLMCMFDRLKELNVIKPAAVDKDGKITELETGNNQPGP